MTASLAILIAAAPAQTLAGASSLPNVDDIQGDTPCEQEIARTIAQRTIGFERGTARIDRASASLVDQLAGLLIACPSAQLHLIDDGAQDCDAPVDPSLSRARAESVASALEQHGVARDQLVARGTAGNTERGGGCPHNASRVHVTLDLTLPPPPPPWWLWLGLLAALLVGAALGYLLRGADGRFGRRRPNLVPLTPIGIRAAAGPSDDLMRIKGIGPRLNDMLLGLGVRRFDQIAAWTPREAVRVDSHLTGFHGRIARESWIEQAELLSRGATDEFEERFGALDYENI